MASITPLDLLQDLQIGEPKHADASLIEIPRPHFIADGTSAMQMLATVNLDG